MEIQDLESSGPIELSEEEQQEIAAASGNIGFLMDEYRQCYDDIEQFNRTLKKYKAKQRALAEALYDAMTAAGLEKGSSGDASFRPEMVKNIAINKSVEEQALEVLESAGLGGIIKRAVNYQTLNKAYRDGGLRNVDQETMSTCFATFEQKTIAMRRKPGSIPTE